jgi:hypothetical protein
LHAFFCNLQAFCCNFNLELLRFCCDYISICCKLQGKIVANCRVFATTVLQQYRLQIAATRFGFAAICCNLQQRDFFLLQKAKPCSSPQKDRKKTANCRQFAVHRSCKNSFFSKQIATKTLQIATKFTCNLQQIEILGRFCCPCAIASLLSHKFPTTAAMCCMGS